MRNFQMILLSFNENKQMNKPKQNEICLTLNIKRIFKSSS